MAMYRLHTPLREADTAQLKIGDVVYLSGMVYTSRDMGHFRIKSLLEDHQALPVDFQGSAIFHAGPVAKKEDGPWKLSVIGPTTSIRMEPYARMIGNLGVKAIIGKGGMADGSLKCFAEYKQVYLQAPPGCAVKLGSAVTGVKDVCWLDMGMPEALWQLEVKVLGPLVVTMDSREESLYENLKIAAYDCLKYMFE